MEHGHVLVGELGQVGVAPPGKPAARPIPDLVRTVVLERAAVFYVLYPRPIKRSRDAGNWPPSAKAYVDGLVDAGLLLDDNATHLAGPYPEIGPPVPSGGARMSLVIVELTPIEP